MFSVRPQIGSEKIIMLLILMLLIFLIFLIFLNIQIDIENVFINNKFYFYLF
jgi:hypothetical protein